MGIAAEDRNRKTLTVWRVSSVAHCTCQLAYPCDMSYRLRVAQESDIPSVRDLIRASVRALQPEYTEGQREAALRTVFTVDTRLVQDGTYFVCVANNGTLAACGGWSYRKTLYGGDHQIQSASAAKLDPAFDAAKVRAIFVHPDHARKGLGSAILKAAEEAAGEAGFRRFEMGSTLAGVPLYTLKGYRETSRLIVPVADGQAIEVVRMEKSYDL